MRYFFGLSLAAVAILAVTLPAEAMPLAMSSTAFESGVTLVRDGCGPFGHRSHYGYCKENGDGGYGGGYGPGEYGAYTYDRGPGLYEGGGYREHRCFIRETYDGPVRICR